MPTKTSVSDIKEKTMKLCKASGHKSISKYYRSKKVFLDHFFWITRYQLVLKESIKGSILFVLILMGCVTNVISEF